MGKIGNGCPSFIKVLNEDDFCKKIRIPQAFVKQYKNKIPRKCQLKRIGCGGRTKSWRVRIRQTGQEHFICRQAWPDFVKDHHLKYGDYLVFRLVEKATFEVVHYGPDCCLKPHASSEDDSDSDSDSDSNSGSTGACDHSNGSGKERQYKAETADEGAKEDKISSGEDDPKSKKQKVTRLPATPRRSMKSKMKKQPIHPGTRKIKTEDGEQEEFNADFDGGFNGEVKNPYFIATLKKYHTSYLYIPLPFAKAIGLEREDHIMLHGEDEHEWSIKICNRRATWTDFWKYYELKIGDTCRFTLLSHLEKVILVEIYRA